MGNFFGNLGDVWTGVNNILQGKVGDGVSDFMRFAVNSTIGIAGLLDISSEAGLPKHKEDFGQTLGKWGVASGPYIVLPLFGSSTLRDTAALPLDFKGDLWSYKDPVRLRNTGTGIRLIDARASVLDASDLIESAALDRYGFIRDAYLQRRESRINDGGESPRSRRSGAGADKDPDAYVPAGPTPEAPVIVKPVVKPDGKSGSMAPSVKVAASDVAATDGLTADAAAVPVTTAIDAGAGKNEQFFALAPTYFLPAQ